MPKLKENDPNPGVTMAVLTAIGDLAQVSDTEMRLWSPQLLPILLDMLTDASLPAKREVSLAEPSNSILRKFNLELKTQNPHRSVELSVTKHHSSKTPRGTRLKRVPWLANRKKDGILFKNRCSKLGPFSSRNEGVWLWTGSQVALWTLAQLIESTGCVVSPYQQFPQLLELLLSFLKTEQLKPIRQQTLRVLGLLGALDPYKHKMNLGHVDIQVFLLLFVFFRSVSSRRVTPIAAQAVHTYDPKRSTSFRLLIGPLDLS